MSLNIVRTFDISYYCYNIVHIDIFLLSIFIDILNKVSTDFYNICYDKTFNIIILSPIGRMGINLNRKRGGNRTIRGKAEKNKTI